MNLKKVKIIQTKKYIKIAGGWDIYPNFHKNRDMGDEGAVLFQRPPLPESEEDIKRQWGKKKKKKNKKRKQRND